MIKTLLIILLLLLLSVTAHASVSRISNGTVTVGVELNCGGTISELWLDGTNIVNNYDCTGRQVQAAAYDGIGSYDSCAGCTGNWEWNPVQGGDRHGAGSVVLEHATTANSIYIKTRPYEWFPDNKGGGPGAPVPSDVFIEQWITFVSIDPRAVKVRWKITHFGTDNHLLSTQELPAVYVNGEYNRLVRYTGNAPWTNGATTVLSTVQQGTNYHTVEKWQAYVNNQDKGLTVYVPGQYSWLVGFQGTNAADQFNYFTPFYVYAFGPGSVMDDEVYLFIGDYAAARNMVYQLEKSFVDKTPPFGFLDSPVPGQSLIGNVTVSGWAFDNVAMSHVEILLDDAVVGIATYGQARPDVAAVSPGAPINTGYFYALDTSKYTGAHVITARAIDSVGNASSRSVSVNINVKPPNSVIISLNNIKAPNPVIISLNNNTAIKAPNPVMITVK